MCRSIVVLRGAKPTSNEDVHAAALQFVRKVSGYRQPSKANVEVFDRAVDEVAAAVRRLLDDLVTPPGARPPALQGSRARAARLARDAASSASG